MNLIVALLIALGLLAGCVTEVHEVTTTVTKTSYAGLDDAWLKPVEVVVPPTRDPAYLTADLQTRVDMWSTWYLRQTSVMGVHNTVLEGADKYNRAKKADSYLLVCKEGQCVEQKN